MRLEPFKLNQSLEDKTEENIGFPSNTKAQNRLDIITGIFVASILTYAAIGPQKITEVAYNIQEAIYNSLEYMFS